MQNASEVGRLRWKKFPVLDDGFVCLVDCMGDDNSIVQAARVSYGKDSRENIIQRVRSEEIEASGNGDLPDDECCKIQNQKDRTLIRYLLRHRHTTPFEMAEVKFLVRVPMDCWRQWIRHRTANVNEYSTRYSEAIDSRQTTDNDDWREQSATNRQGSNGFLDFEEGIPLTDAEEEFHKASQKLYQDRIDSGVAREQARKDLPLSTYTEAYWKIDLHNLFHFLALRMDSHAQLEIRQYATVIGEQIVKPLFPIAWQAFLDYRFNAKNLTATEVSVIQDIMAKVSDGEISIPIMRDMSSSETCIPELESSFPDDWTSPRCRERDEFIRKLELLGMLH